MRKRTDIDIALEGLVLERERNAHSEALHEIHDAPGLADYLRAKREELLTRILTIPQAGRSPVSGLDTARELSDLMDSVIARMFALACRSARASVETLPIAIVATGGYGRRELAPFSDIDITFIPQRDGDPRIDHVIRTMFTLVMEVCIARCGLEVGYAYRLFEDCGSLDHQTACGLLDARFIAGRERIFIQFEDAFWMGFNPADFIFAKLEERDRALEKWGRTPRVVEPQLKEGPGGLRDLQTAVWLAQARNQLAAARVRGKRAFEVLGRDAEVTETDVLRLAAAKEALFQVRHTLHALTRAERDELVITRQEDVAGLLGYSVSEGADPPVERFMADLYPALSVIRRVTDQVMRRIGNSRLMLGIGLDCKRRQIVPANDALESDDPVWLLWVCELAQKYRLELSEGIEQKALALLEQGPVLATDSLSGRVFTLILSQIGRIYPILQKMADLGILGWYLPEFGELMDLIPYDPSHDHTVGQHSLFVIRYLEELKQSDGTEERSEMQRILEELAHPEQLVLAALLHDSGKALPGRPHAEVSEEIAEVVCRRLRWEAEATANVRFLVRQHLLMAEISRLRDLNLDETIRDFTREVDDPERLNMLYLLTYADTRAVGEGVWTQVKGRFLRDLWRRASAVLYDEEPVGYDEAAITRARRRLLKDLSLENLPEAEVAEHVQAMPPNYLLNQSLQHIALHIGFIRRVRVGEPVIDFQEDRNATYTELTVCAPDDPQPGLLAKIAGALYAADLNVHSAQVMTRITETDRIALDTLWIDYRGRPLSPGKRREVSANLTAVLTGAQTPEELLNRKRQSVTRKITEQTATSLSVVSVRNDLSDSLTVVEIAGPDDRGGFYHVCQALSRLGWDIRSARLSTWRGEVRAGFYVEGAHHLPEQEVAVLLSQVLPAGACAAKAQEATDALDTGGNKTA